MIDTIVVGTDFSDSSRKTLDYAAALARRANARILGAHALRPPSSLYKRQKTEELRRWEEEHREKLEGFFRDTTLRGLDVETCLCPGPPEDALGGLALEKKADLILVSKRSRTTIEKFFVGSVTERIASKAPCPVLIIPEEEHSQVRWRPIVCAFDFSHNARLALEYAVRLANKCDADLTVLHAAIGEYDLAETQAKLSEALRVFNAPRSARSRVVEGEKAARTLVEAVEEMKSDLLIVGRKGLNEGDYVGTGSTAHSVLRRATFPLLVVPQRS